MRLDKYLAHSLGISRLEANDLIKKKVIKVNGNTIIKKDFVINESVDEIKYNEQLINYRCFVYYMLNKPKGYVSAAIDKKEKTVLDLISERKDVFPIGRLDKDTEGLLLLTNDGALAHKLSSPKYNCYKTYYVKSSQEFSEEDLVNFRNGLKIIEKGQKEYVTAKAFIEKISPYEYQVQISEGRFHQVKKMFLALDNEVLYLKRIAHGSIQLDKSLALGQYRPLTEQEINALKANVAKKC